MTDHRPEVRGGKTVSDVATDLHHRFPDIPIGKSLMGIAELLHAALPAPPIEPVGMREALELVLPMKEGL